MGGKRTFGPGLSLRRLPHHTGVVAATVQLLTHDAGKQLSLNNIRFAGDSDYLVADLYVLSRGFSCKYDFYFDRFHVERLLSALEEMDQGMADEAVLKQEWEDDHIRFQNDRLGHVIVTGEMVEHGSGHRFAFTIETDQTVLRPFIDEFRESLASAR